METTTAQQEFLQRLLTVAPEATDNEKAYLGGLLMYPEWIYDTPLKPSDFFNNRHAKLFEAMLALRATNQPIDPMLLAEVLENAQEGGALLQYVGGRTYIAELTNSVPVAQNTHHYAEAIRDTSVRRQYLHALDNARVAVLDESKPIEATSAAVESIIGSVTMEASRGGLEHISGAISADLARLDAMFEDGVRPVISVPMFLRPLENVMHGWRIGRLYYVGGYMHSGKTTFMIQGALSAAAAGAIVAFFNAEGKTEDVQREMIAIAAGIPSDRAATGAMTIAEYNHYAKVAADVSKLPIFIDGDKRLDPDMMFRRIRTLKNSAPDKPVVVFVDYLGKLQAPERKHKDLRGDRRLTMSFLSDAMKRTAESLDVCMVVAAQTGRPEKPTNKRKDDEPRRPVAQDLAESADLERDADVIIYPWRADLKERDGEIVVAKNKINGWNGSVPVMFDNAARQWREMVTPRPTNEADVTWRERHE